MDGCRLYSKLVTQAHALNGMASSLPECETVRLRVQAKNPRLNPFEIRAGQKRKEHVCSQDPGLNPFEIRAGQKPQCGPKTTTTTVLIPLKSGQARNVHAVPQSSTCAVLIPLKSGQARNSGSGKGYGA